jgi:copper(I)-binding protein
MHFHSSRTPGRLGSFLILASFVSLAFGHGYQAGAIAIQHPYARPTAPSQPTGGAYFTLVNSGAGDRLLGASTPVASSVQIHTMRMDGDVMRMREVGTLDVPSGQRVELKPGGLHLMLIGLKQPLVLGQSLPMKLRFEKAGEVSIDLKVDAEGSVPRGASASSSAQGAHVGHVMPDAASASAAHGGGHDSGSHTTVQDDAPKPRR